MHRRGERRYVQCSSSGFKIGHVVLAVAGRGVGIEDHRRPLDTGRDLREQLQPLAPIDASELWKPVMLPPGRERLATKPSPTGSDTIANTIGIVCVSRCNAAVTGVPNARITSGLRPTNSFANNRIRSTSSPAQRTSIRRLPPFAHPSSESPLANRESQPFGRESVSLNAKSTPMRRVG